MTPFDILEVSENASDLKIREAYLSKVKTFTPEHSPEMFKRVSKAYEQIKHEKSRIEYYLFNTETGGETPFGVFANYISTKRQYGKDSLTGSVKPVDLQTMLDVFEKCKSC